MRPFSVVLCLISLAPLLIACTNQEPGQPADVDRYLEDIRAEATRTSQLNDRTEALLEHNEMLSATATAAYEEFNETQEPLRVLAQDLAFLLDAVNELLSQTPGVSICDQLTVTRLDGIEGVDPTLAQRIRADFGCAVLQ
jgi:hypothetical protein